ncbi:MAG TPA: LysR substrate-binding domain-containing protein, partial [Polyangiales bacterium]
GTLIEPDALELVALAEQLELGLSALERDGRPADTALAGTVRISMADGFLRPMTCVLSELRRTHPGLHFEVVAETRAVDLTRREADLAIRTVRSSSQALVERPAGRLQLGLYAAHSYVERHLRIPRIERRDFAHHDFVSQDGPPARSVQKKWLTEHGATRFVFRSNSDHAIEEAVLQGEGICLMAKSSARPLPTLVELRCDVALPTVPVYVVFHRELRNVPRFRVVARELGTALRECLA